MAYSKNRRLSDLISADGTLGSTKILDASIATADLADDAITAGKIVDNIALPGNITTSGTLAPVGVLTANAGIVVDNITIDGTEIDLSSGDLTLDVAGDIILDADGGDIKFKDGGVAFGGIFKSGDHLYLQSDISDGDIKFYGSDGGSPVTALTLDMSEAGRATFNENVIVTGNLTVSGTTTTVNSTNTTIADRLIELGTGTSGTPAHDMGLVFERGSSDNAFVGFDESADKFIVGTGSFTGASTGNLTITTGTLVANLEGNVTTAAQPAITSLGTLTSLNVDDITINGSSITDAGNLTMDIGGDLTIDVDGGDVTFNDGGTTFGQIRHQSGDFSFQSSIVDKDIKFIGNDATSDVTALTLDMSDAGSAIFNNNVGIGGTPADPQGFGRALHIEGATNAAVYLRDTGNSNYGYIGFIGGSTNKMSVNSYQGFLQFTTAAGVAAMTIDTSQNVGIGETDPDYQLHIAGGGDLLVEDTGNGSAHIRLRSSNSGTATSNWKLKTSSNNFFYIDNDTGSAGTAIAIDNTGKVGIGVAGPTALLDVRGSGTSDQRMHLISTSLGNGNDVDLVFGRDNGNNLSGRLGYYYNTTQAARYMYLKHFGDTTGIFVTDGGTTSIGANMTQTYKSSSGYPLHVQASTGSQTYIAITQPGQASGNTGFVIGLDATGTRLINREDDPIIFHRASGETMRIHGDGKVGIGTTAPGDLLHVSNGNNAVDTRIRLQAYGQLPIWSTMYAAGTESSPSAPTSGTELMRLAVTTYDGTDYSQMAGSVRITAEANHANNSAPTYMSFWTNPTQRLETEKMRITSGGDVLIGQTSQTGYTFAEKLVVGDGDANDGITIQSGSTHQGNLAFNHSDGTTAYGRISYQHNSNIMSFFVNNSEKLRVNNDGQLKVGTTAAFEAGKFIVSGSGTNGGTMYFNGSFREYRNVIHNSSSASLRYWHIKTNFKCSNSIMFVARVHGYAYGNAGSIIDIQRSGYAFAGNGTVINSAVVNNGTSSHTLETYLADDDYVCFRFDAIGGYYSGMSLDIKFPSPTGYNWDFEVLGHVLNTTSGDHY